MFPGRVIEAYPVVRLRSELDRLFEDCFEGAPAARPFARRAFPTLNIWEDNGKLYVEAELPGSRLEDIELYVDGNELTIKGQRQEIQQEGASFHRRERGVGPFSRVIQLPVEVDAEKVEAALWDGVLTIALPKAQAVLPRRIEVKG